MAMPLLVQEKWDESAFNGADGTFTFDNPLTPGNVVILVFHSTGSTPIPPAGFTEDASAIEGGRPSGVYSKPVVSGDSQTIVMGTNNTTGTVTSELHGFEVANLDLNALRHKFSVGPEGTFTSTQPGMITTTYPETFNVVMAGLGGPSGGGESIAQGFAIAPLSTDNTSGHPRTIVGQRTYDVTVDGLNPFITWTTSRRAISLQVAYKGAEGTPPPPPPESSTAYKAYVQIGGALEPHEIVVT